MKYNIHLVGVGGQGVLLASTVIGSAAMKQGMEVTMSEVHGMAQRGGSVASSVRIGKGVLSPLIPKGGADLLMGFEPSETFKALSYANSGTRIITNIRPIYPIQVSLGQEQYPPVDSIIEAMRGASDHVVAIDATALAIEAGRAIAANSVLIGAVAAVDSFPLAKESMLASLLETLPEKHRNLNRKAFELGFQSQSK